MRWLADRVDDDERGPAPPIYGPPVRSAFEDAEAMEQARREDAMRLMDAETLGYVILLVRDHGSHTKVEPAFGLLDPMWPAVRATLARIEAAGESVYAS
jgi:hypothetical protein